MMWCERIVTEVGRTEVTPDNLADVDDAGQFTLFGNNPISEMSHSPGALEIDVEVRASLRRGRPFPME
jgi:hypothetical protein